MKSVLMGALALLLVAASASAATYKVGDRVAVPTGFNDKFYDAVVVEVDLSKPYPYRVHPLGYTPYADEHFMDKQIHSRDSVPLMPIGGIKSDPWLLKVTGTKAYHPMTLYRGQYECVTGGSSGLESAALINFEVLDASHYRDIGGHVYTYSFDDKSAKVTFHGGGMNGQVAKYEQSTNPPTKTEPPTVTLANGDSCQRHM